MNWNTSRINRIRITLKIRVSCLNRTRNTVNHIARYEGYWRRNNF